MATVYMIKEYDSDLFSVEEDSIINVFSNKVDLVKFYVNTITDYIVAGWVTGIYQHGYKNSKIYGKSTVQIRDMIKNSLLDTGNFKGVYLYCKIIELAVK